MRLELALAQVEAAAVVKRAVIRRIVRRTCLNGQRGEAVESSRCAPWTSASGPSQSGNRMGNRILRALMRLW